MEYSQDYFNNLDACIVDIFRDSDIKSLEKTAYRDLPDKISMLLYQTYKCTYDEYEEVVLPYLRLKLDWLIYLRNNRLWVGNELTRN